MAIASPIQVYNLVSRQWERGFTRGGALWQAGTIRVQWGVVAIRWEFGYKILFLGLFLRYMLTCFGAFLLQSDN